MMSNTLFSWQKLTLSAVLCTVCALPVSADDDWDDDWDDDDYRPRSAQVKKAKTKVISRQKASQIARSRVKNGRVTSIDFDRNDDGRGAVYDVDVRSGYAKYDVKINARTGGVIYVRRDD